MTIKGSNKYEKEQSWDVTLDDESQHVKYYGKTKSCNKARNQLQYIKHI